MHVLVTGASSGIGAALARHWARRGATVSLVAQRAERLSVLALEIRALGGRASVLPTDLSDMDAVDALPARARQALGPVDILVNNAGLDIIGPYEALDLDAAARLLRVNLHAPLRLTRHLVPAMRDRGHGTIVDVASIAAFAMQPYGTHYTASKAALAAAGRQLRWELRSSGVHVLTVYPGPIHTDMGDFANDAYQTEAPLPWGDVDTLAERVLRAVDRQQGELVYPSVYRVLKWCPWLLDWASPWVRVELAGR